jgi:resuscitation-promoting factor RpfA
MQTMGSGRRACWRGVALLAVLVPLEAVIVRSVGPLGAQVRALGRLGDPSGDAVAGLLTVLAVLAELLAAYLLLILALRLAAWLPGASGQLAGRGAGLLTPPVLRCALDGLLGGVLLAQMVLAPVAARAAPETQPDRAPAAAASALAGGGRIASVSEPGSAELQPSVAGRSRTSAGRSPVAGDPPPTTAGHVPGMARALPATSTVPPPTWVPLPTWLGGSQGPGASVPGSTTARSEPGSGPAEPTSPQASGGQGPEASAAGGGTGLVDPDETRSYVIQPGDTLWDVAEAHLSRSQRSPSRIDRYWRQVHAANRDVLGDDPDLIHPGARVVLPPFQPARTGGG